jgi:hypothetical protein
MFAGKARILPKWRNLQGAPLKGRFLALPTNIRLGWKGLPGTNTLAFYQNSPKKPTSGVGSTHKYYTKLERLARDEQPSFLPKLINYD